MKVGWSPPCLKGPCRHNPLLMFGWTIGPMFPMVKGAVWWQCRVVWAIDLAVSHNGWLGWRLMIRIWSARHYWDQHSSRPAQADPGKTRALAPECRWWLFLVVETAAARAGCVGVSWCCCVAISRLGGRTWHSPTGAALITDLQHLPPPDTTCLIDSSPPHTLENCCVDLDNWQKRNLVIFDVK